MSEFFQYLLIGITIGCIYGLISLGYTVVYNATKLINFSHGEFLMLGGMVAAFAYEGGWSIILAVLLAFGVVVIAGFILERTITLSKKFSFSKKMTSASSGVVGDIIITLGFGLVLRGLVQVVLDRNFHVLPPLFEGVAELIPRYY